MIESTPCVMLTLDTSTTSSGIAIFHNGILQKANLINLSNEKDSEKRVKQMALELLELLNLYCPQIIYIEDVKVVRNAITMRQLMRIQGVILGWSLQHDCEFNIIAPTVWRKILSFEQGKMERNELKMKAIEYVKEKYEIETNDDVAEAICIGDAVIKMFECLQNNE